MYFAYSILSLLGFLVVSPYFLYQVVRYKKYIGGLRQRLGYLPITFNVDGEESIWIHAVSVGEALTARALVPELKERYPRLRLFLSTTTMAGQQVARRNIQQLDGVFYFPFDWSPIVRRTLRIVRPRLFIMMETEIWPNLLRITHERGVKTMLINGRISSRSYPRYRLIRPFMRRVLSDVDAFCMQSDESARRIIDLGADPSLVTVTGSLKFDSLQIPAPGAQVKPRDRVLRFFRLSPNRVVVVAGSTLRGEEASVLRAFARIKTTIPNALLILAPRHPNVSRKPRRSRGTHRSRRCDAPNWVSTLSRARMSLSSIQSANWRSSIRSPPPSSSGKSGETGRSQHSRARGVRQTDSLRSTHGQLPRDCGNVCYQRRGDTGAIRTRTRGSAAHGRQRSGPSGGAGRRGARPRRSQPRREGHDDDGGRRRPAADVCQRRRASIPACALTTS